jgi:ribose 5-phosphate isomerase B
MSKPENATSIALGADHAGFALKEHVKSLLVASGETVDDLGTHDESSCDYPDFAHRVAQGVASGRYRLGILICGTGLGMSCAANRHQGIRAAACTEAYAARMARQHNDANVLCMGSRIVGPGVAEDILRAFLAARFEAGRHQRRVDKIELEPNQGTR